MYRKKSKVDSRTYQREIEQQRGEKTVNNGVIKQGDDDEEEDRE
jgi:hypothetical protein